MKTLVPAVIVCIALAVVAAWTLAEEGKAPGRREAIAASIETVPPAAGAAAPKEYIYKKTPQVELNIFVHFPPDWKAADKRPAIVFFFGGGWTNGTPGQFGAQAEYLATRGMVAARADYRVKSRQGTTPVECVEDAKSAVRWLRQKAGELGIDPDRIVAAGGSAGGHIAACTALVEGLDAKDEDKAVSSRPNALVLFNPVLDMERLGGAGGAIDKAKEISPIRYVKKDTPPMVLFYGTKDKFVEDGRAMLAKSKEVGNRVELYTAEDMPHGFFNRPPWTEITVRQADVFLASLGYLKGDPTVKPPADASKSLKREP